MMLELLFLILYAFAWGLRKGSVVCVTICAPGIIPYVAEKQGDANPLKLAFLFNLPRIIALTALGAVVGFFSFNLAQEPAVQDITASIGVLGYILVGFLLLAYGAYLFATGIDEYQDLKEGVCTKCRDAPHARLFRKLAGHKGGEDGMLLAWGGLLALACIGETLMTVELVMLSGLTAALAGSVALSTLVGGMTMFSFALGASIPVGAAMVLGSKLAKNRQAAFVNRLKLVSSIVLLIIGLGIVLLMGLRVA